MGCCSSSASNSNDGRVGEDRKDNDASGGRRGIVGRRHNSSRLVGGGGGGRRRGGGTHQSEEESAGGNTTANSSLAATAGGGTYTAGGGTARGGGSSSQGEGSIRSGRNTFNPYNYASSSRGGGSTYRRSGLRKDAYATGERPITPDGEVKEEPSPLRRKVVTSIQMFSARIKDYFASKEEAISAAERAAARAERRKRKQRIKGSGALQQNGTISTQMSASGEFGGGESTDGGTASGCDDEDEDELLDDPDAALALPDASLPKTERQWKLYYRVSTWLDTVFELTVAAVAMGDFDVITSRRESYVDDPLSPADSLGWRDRGGQRGSLPGSAGRGSLPGSVGVNGGDDENRAGLDPSSNVSALDPDFAQGLGSPQVASFCSALPSHIHSKVVSGLQNSSVSSPLMLAPPPLPQVLANGAASSQGAKKKQKEKNKKPFKACTHGNEDSFGDDEADEDTLSELTDDDGGDAANNSITSPIVSMLSLSTGAQPFPSGVQFLAKSHNPQQQPQSLPPNSPQSLSGSFSFAPGGSSISPQAAGSSSAGGGGVVAPLTFRNIQRLNANVSAKEKQDKSHWSKLAKASMVVGRFRRASRLGEVPQQQPEQPGGGGGSLLLGVDGAGSGDGGGGKTLEVSATDPHGESASNLPGAVPVTVSGLGKTSESPTSPPRHRASSSSGGMLMSLSAADGAPGAVRSNSSNKGLRLKSSRQQSYKLTPSKQRQQQQQLLGGGSVSPSTLTAPPFDDDEQLGPNSRRGSSYLRQEKAEEQFMLEYV